MNLQNFEQNNTVTKSKLIAVADGICAQSKRQGKQLRAMIDKLTDKELMISERTCAFFTDIMGYTYNDIVEAYMWFITTFMESQIEFARTGAYTFSSYAEIEHFYKDKELMKNYYISLALSLHLFPQHLKVMRFFSEKLKSLNDTSALKYLEIGSGHGHLFVSSMENTDCKSYEAVDISQTSIDMATAYTRYCIPDRNNWTIKLMDVLDYTDSNKFDIIVMGEVLEHVETPEVLLNKIYRLSHADTKIYITTATNAPCFDHIYHFKTVDEVEDMLGKCGFEISDKAYGTANDVELELANREGYTIVPAYWLNINTD